MSAVKLTSEQSAVVSDRGGALLVSAAAGSGKTRVLVERLLRRVLDEGAHITDFLVITYTKAAAAELRGRITDALFDRISEEPENRRLHHEADMCVRAQIGTIHSFCARIIRENAHLAGVSPDFRVADESESEELKRETLSELLDDCYDEGDEGFLALSDTMGAGRDDRRLAEIVLDTHRKLLSHPYPEKWASEQEKAWELSGISDVGETVWGRLLMEKAGRWTEYWIKRLDDILSEAEIHPDFLSGYGDSMSVTLSGLRELKKALDGSWDGACAAVRGVEFPKAKAIKGYDDWKNVRNTCKKEREKLSQIFFDGSEKVLSDMKAVFPQVRELLRLVMRFEGAYSEKKRKRNILDFSDQEHIALKILIDPETGEKTPAAEDISRRYREIMVDEYQDVNAVQELIFHAVSREDKNVFMVGDVKQSVYRFRLADPTIFLRKYNSFPDAADASEGQERKLVLSRNFRSRAEILSAVNFVFGNVMSTEFGEMDYGERESLHPGAEYPETCEASVELDILDASGDDDEETPEKTDAEAAFVARRIRELTENTQVSDGAGGMRPVRYGDVAVLMRSPSGKARRYAAAMAAEGIPTTLETGTDFFETEEISALVSLLTVIDNPRQDIPLIAVMRGPVYGFSADELADIRAEKRDGDFYTALKARSESDDKCKAFLGSLERLRETAPDMSVNAFLWHICTETGLFAIVSAMPGGERRKRNIMLLLDMAKNFESAGFRGLFAFVSYLRGMTERGENPLQDAAVTQENAVTIMSIHKSKGLEFPIVILADLAKRFNTDDSKKPLLIHPQLGIGPKLTDTVRRISYPTLPRMAIREQMMSEGLSEELRVLYVAMTRAREKLIMTASFGNAERELKRLCGIPLPVPPQLAEGVRSPADWVLMPALRRAESAALSFGEPCAPAPDDGTRWDVRLITASGSAKRSLSGKTELSESSVSEEELKALREKLEWRYPYESSSCIPAKVTATELKGRFSDEEASEDAQPLLERFSRPPRRPAFLEDERRLTAAEKGTAAHLVMQYADYERCLSEEGVRGEIERLVSGGFITREQADSVRPGIISGVFASETGKLMRSADKLFRELKFSVLVDSGELPDMAPGEQVLLQGVVDCCAEKDGKLTVIDFKTDYVNKETASGRAEYYKGQLEAYSLALGRMTGLPVERRILYFLTAGLTAEI